MGRGECPTPKKSIKRTQAGNPRCNPPTKTYGQGNAAENNNNATENGKSVIALGRLNEEYFSDKRSKAFTYSGCYTTNASY